MRPRPAGAGHLQSESTENGPGPKGPKVLRQNDLSRPSVRDLGLYGRDTGRSYSRNNSSLGRRHAQGRCGLRIDVREHPSDRGCDRRGLRPGATAEIVVVPVAEAEQHLDRADLIVVGGPTHAHGMSRETTRKLAVDQARNSERQDLTPTPTPKDRGSGTGSRHLGTVPARAAAFDTRFRAPAALTGRASKRIGRELVRHGCTLIADPESFLVTKRQPSRTRRGGTSARLGGAARSSYGAGDAADMTTAQRSPDLRHDPDLDRGINRLPARATRPSPSASS